MGPSTRDQLSKIETTCESLLYELQVIWNEVGESDAERDKMLLELEQECLEVYKRKVDIANRSRANLCQAIADVEAELATICSAMGERPVHLKQSNQNAASLKEELMAITPQLEEMKKRKSARLSQFLQIMEQIRKISSEIWPNGEALPKLLVDETDLSTRKLEELQRQLEALQKEKADRLNQVLEHLNALNALCIVLGVDFKRTVIEVHPSLDEAEGTKIVSNDVIERLASIIQRLRDVKVQRMNQLQDLATTMLELWNLMDTPIEEQQLFQNVTCLVAASENELTEPNTLSADFLNYVEAEVLRLEELKGSKMKELLLKKKIELEELRRKTHLVVKENSELEIAIEAIEAGVIDPSLILEQIEAQISGVKEEAFSRKEILERVEKWMAACEEEAWLEEYNRDENRYSAGRGAHLALKRAEKARAAVQRIPGIVEALCNKIIAWEKERGTDFTYDGVRLLPMLEDYTFLREQKELERKRQRDQKKLQSQLIAEQEALFGSKPSPSKPQSAKKMPRASLGGASRRLSLGAAAIQPTKPDFLCSTKTTKRANERSFLVSPAKNHVDTGISVKKLSFNSTNLNGFQSDDSGKHYNATKNTNAKLTETPRKPFAPLTPTSNLPFTPQIIHNVVAEEENWTPKTTRTMSTPMKMANTPAPFSAAYEAEPASITKATEEMEYSFEERRLLFYSRR
ncbi:LOW QUALITY PROTEIN: 65-kDa microtubule-associated protein 3-like [Phalaenopsis equestris]|uniref:LOW QUALITY PROTEIN: 65-kDa microtubule-associated protein 3-like n=1 Tax=Phalaenopsis equestris TaxID=78828 RepID=UPI0009E55AA0|nr:LOW QUALITY PROTEIN: 65-kDa microtubule-associated protein 3-like [Phalaenopsis equestris]